jgi:hypothetical protein
MAPLSKKLAIVLLSSELYAFLSSVRYAFPLILSEVIEITLGLLWEMKKLLLAVAVVVKREVGARVGAIVGGRLVSEHAPPVINFSVEAGYRWTRRH